MECTEEMVKNVIDAMFRRCAAARAIGGIALRDVVDGTAEIPDGWALDFDTDYFIPPNVRLF